MEWRPVCGYEGYYEVSNTGVVRSLDRTVIRSDGVVQKRRGKQKAQVVGRDGYVSVKLSKDGVDKTAKVHRVVACAFLGVRDGNMFEVNHIDFNRLNNNVENLEWVTHNENIAHTIGAGRHVSQTADFRGENNPNYGNHKLKDKYSVDKEYSLEKQSRPGASNGRARQITMTLTGGTQLVFPYIAKCAEHLVDNGIVNCNVRTVAANISKAAKTGQEYNGIRFHF